MNPPAAPGAVSTRLSRRARGQRARRVAAALAILAFLASCSAGDEPPASGPDGGPAPGNATTQRLAPEEASDAPSVPAELPRPRALWVLCEGAIRVLEAPERVDRLVADALALGASDLFVQVYRGGRAWYDATLADPTPFRQAQAAFSEDPLQRLISQAHRAGLRVHAWVNVLSLSQNGAAPILSDLGRDALLVDRRGRSLLDYPNYEVPAPDRDWYRMGTRGLYLDPANPAVADRLVATFSELIDRYPELDGLHLDYIRHPDVLPFVPGSRFGVGLDFGYGAIARQRFQRETGLTAPGPDGMVNTNRWDDWRRDQVTALVASIASEARARRPGLVLSAAVIAYLDRAYLSMAQDWPRWLEEGWIDVAVPMTYTLDDRLLRYQLERFGGHPRKRQIWAGLGSWLFAKDPQRARGQVELARRSGVGGEALFSYDSIAEARDGGLLDVLRPRSARPEPGGDG